MNKKLLLITIAIIVCIILSIVFWFIIGKKLTYRCPYSPEEVGKDGWDKYIDCMPPGDETGYCKSEYRQWINENCPWIKFTD